MFIAKLLGLDFSTDPFLFPWSCKFNYSDGREELRTLGLIFQKCAVDAVTKLPGCKVTGKSDEKDASHAIECEGFLFANGRFVVNFKNQQKHVICCLEMRLFGDATFRGTMQSQFFGSANVEFSLKDTHDHLLTLFIYAEAQNLALKVALAKKATKLFSIGYDLLGNVFIFTGDVTEDKKHTKQASLRMRFLDGKSSITFNGAFSEFDYQNVKVYGDYNLEYQVVVPPSSVKKESAKGQFIFQLVPKHPDLRPNLQAMQPLYSPEVMRDLYYRCQNPEIQLHPDAQKEAPKSKMRFFMPTMPGL